MSELAQTDKVARFLAANQQHAVVSGYALEMNPDKPSRGVVYRLENGETFRLNSVECKSVGYPRWKLDDAG